MRAVPIYTVKITILTPWPTITYQSITVLRDYLLVSRPTPQYLLASPKQSALAYQSSKLWRV